MLVYYNYDRSASPVSLVKDCTPRTNSYFDHSRVVHLAISTCLLDDLSESSGSLSVTPSSSSSITYKPMKEHTKRCIAL